MTALAPTAWWRGLAGLTRSGSAVEGLSWALYDFANTIFSFAIVSFAMGPWATRFLGEATGTLAFTVTASASVLVNALVSPALGAMSDRTGGRKRYLLVFTVLCVGPAALIGLANIWIGLLAFGVANFGYQAALIYYDALLPDVARPNKRGRLSGVGVALGYLGTIVSGLLLRFTTDGQGLDHRLVVRAGGGPLRHLRHPAVRGGPRGTAPGRAVPGEGCGRLVGPAGRHVAARR